MKNDDDKNSAKNHKKIVIEKQKKTHFSLSFFPSDFLFFFFRSSSINANYAEFVRDVAAIGRNWTEDEGRSRCSFISVDVDVGVNVGRRRFDVG